jgi:predicted enzyme related to lactoylglutathione lyase
MTSIIRTVIYPVKDLARAKTLYCTLVGVAPYADEAYYVEFRVGDQEVGLDPHGHSKGMTGPVGYWQVADIKESLKLLLDAGAEVRHSKLIASIPQHTGGCPFPISLTNNTTATLPLATARFLWPPRSRLLRDLPR